MIFRIKLLTLKFCQCGIAVIAANIPILFPVTYNALRRIRRRMEPPRSPSPISFRRPTGYSAEAETTKRKSVDNGYHDDNEENANSDVSTLSVVGPPSQIGSTSSLISRS